MVLVPSATELHIGGDCNPTTVWVNGELRAYESPYPQGDFAGGVRSYLAGPSIEALGSGGMVTPDRSLLSAALPRAAYGPWFEAVISDNYGTLWAYYHAEFITPDGSHIHPRIGAQVSYDNGATWRDLGIIIDTPAGSDATSSWLGYGFVGGNGDCSVMLDAAGEYLYLFFSQYGVSPQTQGVGIARMRWADRSQPVGKVLKWHAGAWATPGVGGMATPVLANVGDAHGIQGAMDFWWGPAVHWNTHLGRYVMVLSRSTLGGFTNTGPENWIMFGERLDDPSSWSAPTAIVYPDGYNGGWYPAAIGLGAGETDRLSGREARFFVSGLSRWKALFLRPGELAPGEAPPIAITRPLGLSIQVGGGGGNQIIAVGAQMDISSLATDAEGHLLEHWLEIQRPGGQWSWEGWLNEAPWEGALVGSGFTSRKQGAFLFNEEGVYTVRASMLQSGSSDWIVSAEIKVHVGGIQTRPVCNISVGGEANHTRVAQGTTLPIVSRAVDGDGNMQEHWLEIRRPDGQWSWEGWLLSAPWDGVLGGGGAISNKTASFTFNQLGEYLVRSSAVDPDGQWVISEELRVVVVP